MDILIDTHILIWYIEGNSSLNNHMLTLLEDTDNNLYISIASLWEMSIKLSIGKLNLSITFHELASFLDQLEIKTLPITFADTEICLGLPFHHNDPFDRMIISQSINQSLAIMTADHAFKNYPCNSV